MYICDCFYSKNKHKITLLTLYLNFKTNAVPEVIKGLNNCILFTKSIILLWHKYVLSIFTFAKIKDNSIAQTIFLFLQQIMHLDCTCTLFLQKVKNAMALAFIKLDN